MAFAVIAGLISCPLTLFVMVLSNSKGVPEASLVFAIAMLAGVGLSPLSGFTGSQAKI